MNRRKLWRWSIVVALAGFLFGFDTVVISGADRQLQQLWGSSDLFHGVVVMGVALWGTVLGAVFGALPTNRLGRRRTLIGIGVLFLVSAIGSALASGPYDFAVFRLLGGIGIGVSTIVAPAYVSEIAPASERGRLVALYQFNIVFGILAAFVSNYLLQDAGENAWRWMMGVVAVPALAYTVLVLRVPESPRWLVEYRKDRAGALKVLLEIHPEAEAAAEVAALELEKSRESPADSSFLWRCRKPLVLAFFMAFFNQMSGINAFLYYAPRIFELAGLGTSASFLSSVGVGAVNLVFTLLGIALIDRHGRRTLMLIGSVGYIVSLGLVSAAFALHWPGLSIPLFFFLFIAAHAIGQGAVIWVFISEIFPNRDRAAGQAFGSTVHWVLAALIPSLVPLLFRVIGPAAVFLGFCLMMVWQLLWVLARMPETRGRTLEDLAAAISRR